MTKTHTKTLFAIAAIAAASFAGAASASAATARPLTEEWVGPELVAQGPSLSRADVQADLNLWNRAGLSGSNSGESYADNTPAYAARLAQYQRQRSGAEYQAEVTRLGGNTNTMAGARIVNTAN